jgi:hypothetical protein
MEEKHSSNNKQLEHPCHHEAAIWGVLLLSLFFAAAAFLGVTVIWLQNVTLKAEMRELASEIKDGQTYYLDKTLNGQSMSDKASASEDGEEVSEFDCEDEEERYALPGSMRELCVPDTFGVLSYEKTASNKFEWRIRFSETGVLGSMGPADPSEVGDSGVPVSIDFECLNTLSADDEIASCWLGAPQDVIERTSKFTSEGKLQTEIYEFSVRTYDVGLDAVREEPSTYFVIPSEGILFSAGSDDPVDATREMVRSL